MVSVPLESESGRTIGEPPSAGMAPNQRMAGNGRREHSPFVVRPSSGSSVSREGAPPAYILSFAELDRHSLAVAGGKAANLGEMTRAGLPVPPGFCITTRAYAAVATGTQMAMTTEALDITTALDADRLAELAARARDALLLAPVPPDLSSAIVRAYASLGSDTPVAVRSSATAEDLPTASFAGQQETYLNVVGTETLLEAVRRCWASLWTERAVAYRAKNGIRHSTVRLAVVVQQMVDARVAGVLFTANPLTGRRQQAVIDASPGLGEAVVSGAVTPDQFVVQTALGEIVQRKIADKQVRIDPVPGGGTRRVEQAGVVGQCLSDAEVRALAKLGERVERHYGAPQDIEWAIDGAGHIWLVQTRPITTLFPLPPRAKAGDQLRVYFSFNVAQGVYGPLTPMGIQALRLISSGMATWLGYPQRNPSAGAPVFVEAAHRLFLDVTPVLSSTTGRRLARFALSHMEVRSGAILERLFGDPRLAPLRDTPMGVIRIVGKILRKTRVPVRVAQALIDPDGARRRSARALATFMEAAILPAQTTTAGRVDLVEQLLYEVGPRGIVPVAAPVLPAAFISMGLASRLLKGLAAPEEIQAVLRGLPHNPTTEMDLQLWALVQHVRQDQESAQMLRTETLHDMAVRYRDGALPKTLQRGLAAFLEKYGHRGVAEIDLGVPRWADDPKHILGALANYLSLENLTNAPDVQFARMAREARAMVLELSRRAGQKNWLRGRLVGLFLDRAHQLAGLREMPKYTVISVLAKCRTLLLPVGEELAGAGRIDAPEDIFFLTLPEARVALAGADLRPVVRERRESYERERQRRHVPRMLLSDGSEPEAEATALDDVSGVLRGSPASAGTLTATARVILDPHGARLEPGEILVAPSTDPGWTPLFLTAGGLVMEMGGPMSHGAVVAREYGIPAVVGVPGATEHIQTGQRITVDGAKGTVTLEGSDVEGQGEQQVASSK
jgi:rifampicin phosphotransferase